MSYTQAIDEVKAAVEAVSGLTYCTEPRISTLADLTDAATFDGAFLLRDESGPIPWPEEANNPTDWHCTVALEFGTILGRDALEAGKTLASRARAIIKALPYVTLTYGAVYNWQRPEKQRLENDRRILWIVRFDLRYFE